MPRPPMTDPPPPLRGARRQKGLKPTVRGPMTLQGGRGAWGIAPLPLCCGRKDGIGEQLFLRGSPRLRCRACVPSPSAWRQSLDTCAKSTFGVPTHLLTADAFSEGQLTSFSLCLCEGPTIGGRQKEKAVTHSEKGAIVGPQLMGI
ncbi:hypothetical protein JTE90_024360 [Oedothorax gibbosus]|uniref:Uncharacterized protein n=1 Tax=Oedothorax gibbosus TaxID=931172 RepID=A0AAV6VZD5_9ARAC|nr:hypothetical protein JTE90_024360 [Oedothorax gibbosus]